MSDKEIEVRCPCCESTLVIDVRTRTVLKHAPPQQVDETGKLILDPARWDQASARVQGRTNKATDAFDAALAKEHSRARDLDDLFDKARKKVERRGDRDSDDAAPEPF
ncbi:MAG: hypothetical protein R3F49_09870 [Planctomycetota bacterium]